MNAGAPQVGECMWCMILTSSLLCCAYDRYHLNTNPILAGISKSLKWADGAALRATLTAAVEALLGPKTEADLKPPEKKKKVKVVCICTFLAALVAVHPVRQPVW